ncbi:MAG: hypothetical protein JWL97_4410 [Gemmatimonadales bacterium]|nr:hypothetical protein [Gemmatimonadales bacterium]
MSGAGPVGQDGAMSFFDDLPRRPEPPENDVPERSLPEWLGPPRDVMGGVVPVAELVVRTAQVFVGLRAVTAYPTGLSLSLALVVRRGELPRERWQALEASFWADPPLRRGAIPSEGALRLGVELADGRRTGTLDRSGLRPDSSPEPPVLIEQSGGGSGGARTMDRRVDLWLWPLPEGEFFSLVLQWPDLEIPVTAHRVDLEPVRAAAQRAMPFWP